MGEVKIRCDCLAPPPLAATLPQVIVLSISRCCDIRGGSLLPEVILLCLVAMSGGALVSIGMTYSMNAYKVQSVPITFKVILG